MKRDALRFFPVLVLFLVACTSINAGTAPASTPTVTASATNIPLPGDLGFGIITGKVMDADTGLPIPNATVTCEHYSYTSNEADRCNRTAATDPNGVFLFEKVFFHDTDSIQLTVDASGYQTEKIKQAFFTWKEWRVDISLKRLP